MAAGHDAAGNVERLAAGTSRLPTFFCLGDSGDDSEFLGGDANSAGWRNLADERRKFVKKKNCFERASLPRIKAHHEAESSFHPAGRAAGIVRGGACRKSGVIFTNAAPAARAAIPRRSSIIFIQCHGLGYGDLSCYGQTNFQTPNLDRLAAEGTRFTDYRAAVTRCLGASRADAGKQCRVRAPAKPRWPRHLQQAGYHTGLIGEWMLGAQPWTKGFDEFAGFLTRTGREKFLCRLSSGVTRRSSIYDETNHTVDRLGEAGRNLCEHRGQKGKYLPDLLMSATANFVQINQPDFANHYRPFFLLVNLPAPDPPRPGKDDFPVPTDAPFTGETWPQAAKNRAALITRLDGGIGRLFEQFNNLQNDEQRRHFFHQRGRPGKIRGHQPEFFEAAVKCRRKFRARLRCR